MGEEIEFRDPQIDQSRLMCAGLLWKTDRKGNPVPLYSVNEAAKFFFARTGHWLRWHDSEGRLVYENVKIPGRELAGKPRSYYLSDIEKIAHGLAAQNQISGMQLRGTLLLIRYEAEIWGYI